MGKFSGKVVWITGASSGIGEALSKSFWKEGAHLVLSARRLTELERVKSGLKQTENQRVFILPMDLADTLSSKQHTDDVIRQFGQIDVLINNAGLSQRSYTIDTPLEIDRKIMEVNFFGTVALTKAVLPYMVHRKTGLIIVISSLSGKFGFYLRSAYAASKHALHGFFESLRMEVYKDNVQVMIVCPGKISTAFSLSALTADGQVHNKMDNAMAKGMPAEECAERILMGVIRGEEEINVGGKEIRSVWIKRLFPGLFSKLIRKQKIE
ncbi:MAG: SDR family oxidoreductase [Chitinophagaceae bacterium]